MSAVPQDAEMMWRAINQAFMNQINVIVNYMGNFEINMLALLSDADYKQRRKAVGVIARTFMNSTYRKTRLDWTKAMCDAYLAECYHRVKDGIGVDKKTGEEYQKYRDVCHDEPERDIWTNMKLRTIRLEVKNDGVLEMAKAALALFRKLGFTEAFEAYEETVADILGVEKRGAVKAKSAISAQDTKQSFKERLAEKMKRSQEDGVLPKEAPIAE
jgi:hypothetical protein